MVENKNYLLHFNYCYFVKSLVYIHAFCKKIKKQLSLSLNSTTVFYLEFRYLTSTKKKERRVIRLAALPSRRH